MKMRFVVRAVALASIATVAFWPARAEAFVSCGECITAIVCPNEEDADEICTLGCGGGQFREAAFCDPPGVGENPCATDEYWIKCAD